MVKHHYKSPVQLLPSLRDVLRLNTVQNREDYYATTYEDTMYEDASENSESHSDHSKKSHTDNSFYEDNNARLSNLSERLCNREKVNGIFELNGEAEQFLENVLKESEVKTIKSECNSSASVKYEMNGLNDNEMNHLNNRCFRWSRYTGDTNNCDRDIYLNDNSRDNLKYSCREKVVGDRLLKSEPEEEHYLPNGLHNGSYNLDVKSEVNTCFSNSGELDIESKF